MWLRYPVTSVACGNVVLGANIEDVSYATFFLLVCILSRNSSRDSTHIYGRFVSSIKTLK